MFWKDLGRNDSRTFCACYFLYCYKKKGLVTLWEIDGSMNFDYYFLMAMKSLKKMSKEEIDSIPEIEGNIKINNDRTLIFYSGKWIDIEKETNRKCKAFRPFSSIEEHYENKCSSLIIKLACDA